MSLHLFKHIPTLPRRLGILPGTFNPPTIAHIALAKAALDQAVDEVLFVLPRAFPHKPYEGASFEDRISMLLAALEHEPRFSLASAEESLFLDIARAAREQFPEPAEFHFICGRDAAERIVAWDYQGRITIEEILNRFHLLVADRLGEYCPPPHLQAKMQSLALAADYNEVSATEIRRRIAANEPWTHLVPRRILDPVRSLYSNPRPPTCNP